MARLGNANNANYLSLASSLVQGPGHASGAPLTVSVWFYCDSIAASRTMIGFGSTGTTSEFYSLDVTSGGVIRTRSATAGGTSNAQTTATITLNTWMHAAGRWNATNSRDAFLSGGNKVNNTGNRTPGTWNRTEIGRRGTNTNNDPFSGRLAEIGVWNAALSDDEIAALALGYSPFLFKPENLVMYVPLLGYLSPEPDLVSGNTFTINGTVAQADHFPGVLARTNPKTYFHVVSSGFSGTISVTTDAVGAALSGAETFSGTISVTTAAASSSASATETFSGTIAVTSADAGCSASGSVIHNHGTIAVTTAAASCSASATETFSGTVSVTTAATGAALEGAVTYSGTISVTTTNASVSASGAETFSGTVSVTTANASSSASGTETFTGTINVTTEAVSAAFTGSDNREGTIAVTTENASFSGSAVSLSGQISVTTGAVAASMSGAVTYSGTLSVTSADASCSASATEKFSGTIGVTTDAVSCAINAGISDNLLIVIAAGELVVEGNAPTVVLTGHDSQGRGQVVRVDIPDMLYIREPSVAKKVTIQGGKLVVKHNPPTITFVQKSRRKRVTIRSQAHTKIEGYAPTVRIDYNDNIVISELLTIINLLESQNGNGA